MKGKMKKILALALATVMLLAMGMTAFATEEAPSYSISLKEGTVPTGHTYKVYQIFKGTIDTSGTVLSDIEYGANYAGNPQYTSAYDEAKTISNANAFAESITLKAGVDPVATIAAGESSATLTESGYYLVIDESTVQGEDRVSKFIVNVGGNITIEPKLSSVPGFEKTAADGKNVTAAAGEDIAFTLKATMPDDIGNYDAYKLVFKDTLTNLTFKADTVKVVNSNGKEYVKDKDYTLAVDGNNFTITMADIKHGDNTITVGTEIIVTYTATLAANVDSGEVAKNEAKLEYGNNGDNQGSGTTTTEEVKVYTFKLVINKVDENNNALNGAGFTLYDNAGAEVATIAAGTDDDEVTTFEFKGLKAGTYNLVETTVPNGYNKMDDKTIVLGASEVEGTYTANPVEGWTPNGFTFSTEIQNFAGVQLPSTGGIGTTIFYVVGGILVLGACVLLVTKKRMSARD